jgi:Tol biopolymer transport system component
VSEVGLNGKIGNSAVRLTETWVGSNLGPSWSPDGKSIAFKRRGNQDIYDLIIRSLETGRSGNISLVPLRLAGLFGFTMERAC